MSKLKTIEECLADLSSRLESGRDGDRTKLGHALAELFPATYDATYRWLSGKHLPVGVNLIRLQTALGFLGYELQEEENLPQSARDMRTIIGFGLLSMTEISGKLGINRDSILRIAKGYATKPRTAKHLHDIMIDQRRLGGLAQAQTVWRKALHFAKVKPPVFPVRRIKEHSLQAEITISMDREMLLDCLAGMIKTMLPLATLAASDSFTSEERETLRKLVGKEGVFNLKNQLVRLCGERAREVANQDGGSQ